MKKLCLWLLCLCLTLALAGCVKTDASNTLQGLDAAELPAETQTADAPVETETPLVEPESNFNG